MRVETINPSENKDLWIKLPVVETKVHSSNKLEFFPIEMKLEELKKIKAKIVRADIVTQQTEEIEAELEIKEEIDPVNRFVRLIIKEISEIDVTFKEVLQKLVKHYLDQLGVDRKTLSELVKQHEQTILNDMLPQIRSKLSEDTKIEFKVLDTELGYEPYSKAVKVSSVILNKNEANEAEARSNLISGYMKSVYSTYTFDSAQEKLLADSLDNDKSVKAWVRLRLGQLPIKYLYGSNYNPDFVVEREDGYYLVEVKDKSKIDKKDPEVFSKAAKAEEWCEVATKATNKKWIYKLIPHDAIDRINTFDAIISSAYKI